MQTDHYNFSNLPDLINEWASDLGLNEIGISTGNTEFASPKLRQWLDNGFHGEMEYMADRADLRCAPQQLVPGTISIISTSINYWPFDAYPADLALQNPELAYVSRYALGRDYHKVFRLKLKSLALRIENHIGPFGYRVFTDSAPIFEVDFAAQANLGWRGKHSLLLNRRGSWHFLGEIFTNLPLVAGLKETESHCGTCKSCIERCPTGAIVEPYVVDARRCISYLTIENKGPIPIELRPAMGNRVYGCDDCQLYCPWNRFAAKGDESFKPKFNLDHTTLCDLFEWTEVEFLERFSGSPIRRIGYQSWLRNLAVAMGNALNSPAPEEIKTRIESSLRKRPERYSALVKEHVSWALSQRKAKI